MVDQLKGPHLGIYGVSQLVEQLFAPANEAVWRGSDCCGAPTESGLSGKAGIHYMTGPANDRPSGRLYQEQGSFTLLFGLNVGQNVSCWITAPAYGTRST